MVAVCLVLVLAMAGLVMDGGLAYLVKARLNAAVDAAAVAGARAVTTGNTEAQQRASAQQAAAEFFAANIPSSYMLSKPKLLGTTVSFNGGMVTVDVKAEAPMPVSLMQVMGATSMTPVASAQTIRQDLDMAFVIDTSASLDTAFPAVKTAAKSFLEKFNMAQDRVSLIHFSYGAVIDKAIRPVDRGFDRPAMINTITNYSYGGGTASVEGMWQARQQLNSILDVNKSTLRVIVFFSDGEPTSFGSFLTLAPPNAGACKDRAGTIDLDGRGMYKLNAQSELITGCNFNGGGYGYVKQLPEWYNAHETSATGTDNQEFRIKATSPRPVSLNVGDAVAWRTNVDRAARNLVEAVAAKAQDEGIFVFTLGLGANLKVPKGIDNEIGENVLKCMANVADGPARCHNPNKPVGMYCHAATQADLTPCFSRLASAILRISK